MSRLPPPPSLRAVLLGALLILPGCGSRAIFGGAATSWCALDDPATVERERIARKLAKADVGDIPCHNPAPVGTLPDEIAIPLPCGRRMIFRKVSLSLPSPLAFESATFGDPDAAEGYQKAISGPWRANVAGTFSSGGGQAWYYIGKYEVTVPQLAALADPALEPGKEPGASSGACKAERAAEAAVEGDQVLPAVHVSWPEAMAYADRISRWLIAYEKDHGGVGAVLPGNEARPGFVRLPTEVEWEFAARGGNTSDTQGRTYDTPLAWPAHALADLGWYHDVGQLPPNGSAVFPVGRKAPNRFMLFDMIGNAEELVFDLFHPVRPDQQIAGQAGGAVARGGSAEDGADGVGVGTRREIELYDAHGPHSGAATGFRLVIAAPLFVNRRNAAGQEMSANPDLQRRIASAWATLQGGATVAGGDARASALADLDRLRAGLAPGDAIGAGLDHIRQNLLLSSSQVTVRDAQTTEEQFLTAILAAAYAREKTKTLREWHAQADDLGRRADAAAPAVRSLLDDIAVRLRGEDTERNAAYAYYAQIVADLGRRDRAALARAATAVGDRLRRGGLEHFMIWTPILLRHAAQASGAAPTGPQLVAWQEELEAAQRRPVAAP